MMDDPAGKAFTLVMVDRVFRSHDPHLQANRLREYLKQFGLPRYLPTTQKLLMRTGALASRIAPGPVMKAMENELRRSSARVILAGEKRELQQYLRSRKAAGTRVNLNQLGEAVLGEQEAHHRMEMVLSHLADPAVDYISVKISAIYSQINIIDWDNTLATIKDRLRSLYRAAAFSPSPGTPGEGRGEGDIERKAAPEIPNHPHPRTLPEYRERGLSAANSSPSPKFINLDMEEYRDLEMTLAAFQQVLDEDEFQQARAGIVLQAYLPDSWNAQQRLTAWAKEQADQTATGQRREPCDGDG
jgi:RHH-type proline utilization regulon transcriptional repressor/proline dehydrogenase/delta 1-pyrroline-5-carboxylate dehydrogenase